MNYLRFIGMLARCRMVLTDSGGIQEESTFLKIPCLTMRENTERLITWSLDTNVLVRPDPRAHYREIKGSFGGGDGGSSGSVLHVINGLGIPGTQARRQIEGD